MSTARQEQARAEIAELIARLQPGALDAGSREVLNNLINARTDAQLAELDAARDERQAVVDNLVALAAEQVARYKPRYDADLARVGQTGSALAADLRGVDRPDRRPSSSRRARAGPATSPSSRRWDRSTCPTTCCRRSHRYGVPSDARQGFPVTYADEPSGRGTDAARAAPARRPDPRTRQPRPAEPDPAEPSPIDVPAEPIRTRTAIAAPTGRAAGRARRSAAARPRVRQRGRRVRAADDRDRLLVRARPGRRADVAAFHQVVSLVLRDQGDALVWLMVVGLTAIALTLAHFAGRLARDVTAGHGTATWKQVFACAIPWVALGLAAFAVRLIVADSSGGTTVDGTIVGGGDVGTSARQASAAVLFLALYVGSGAVAAFGEFLQPQPVALRVPALVAGARPGARPPVAVPAAVRVGRAGVPPAGAQPGPGGGQLAGGPGTAARARGRAQAVRRRADRGPPAGPVGDRRHDPA